MDVGHLIAQAFGTIALTISALLPIVNPFSTAALFMSLSGGLSPKERVRQAYMACVYMFFILAFFLIAGAVIMNFFGISVAGIRVAGGLASGVFDFIEQGNPENSKKNSEISFHVEHIKVATSLLPLPDRKLPPPL